MKIAIVGYGYVGKAMYKMVKDNYETIIFDPAYEETATKDDVNKCDLAIVCVPTPISDDGSCDISIVEDVVGWIDCPLILLKSTVAVGTTDYLKEKYKKRICFSPEYAGESSYWTPYTFHTDMKACPFMTIGGDKEDTAIMVDVFSKIMGPVKEYHQSTSKEAEMAKYMENSFYALKVTFCNEMYEICKSAGVEYWKVRELWLADPRINKMHTLVFKDRRGYGGKCYPKDIAALIKTAELNNYTPDLLKQVVSSNEKFKKLNEEII